MCLGFGLMIMLDSNSSRCASTDHQTRSSVETNVTFPQSRSRNLSFHSRSGGRMSVPNTSHRPSSCYAPERYGNEYGRIRPHPYAWRYHWYFDRGRHLFIRAEQAADADPRYWRLLEWAVD